jgi:hypothetical protein
MIGNNLLTSIGNNTKSHKSIGIKRNNTTHTDIGDNKNLVKVDKNIPT